MYLLVLASLIWGFSFGIIGNLLAGLPPAALGMVRMLIAVLVFVPFARTIPLREQGSFFAIGMLQFGVMYLAYMYSFQFLSSHVVALFTVTTPLYITVVHDLTQRRFRMANHLSAIVAIVGAGIIVWQGMSGANLSGFILVQLANLCFALGQIMYRNFLSECQALHQVADHQLFAWLYLGGAAALLPWAAVELRHTLLDVTLSQIVAVIYLGVVATGLGFFCWNRGARAVSAVTLAVMNNLKIPLSVVISLIVFRENVDLATLGAGILLLTAAVLPHAGVFSK